MNANNTLEPTLREILRVIIPLEEDYSVRSQIINDLQVVVDSLESLEGATVEPYGSFVSNLFSRWGDLDISIEIPNGSYILSAARKRKLSCLEDLQKVLRNQDLQLASFSEVVGMKMLYLKPVLSAHAVHLSRKYWHFKYPECDTYLTLLKPMSKISPEFVGSLIKIENADGWRRLKFIANARIPILKCKNSYANISCDISFNNLGGHMKSKILFWLKKIDGRFRQMVLLVKEWAKAHDINDPKNGSFNSYCLTLLVIFHLQTCMPAILPPLGEIYPGDMVNDLRGVRSVAEGRIEETCTENINKFNRLKERNPIPLCELFVSFLAKFCNINSWAPTQGICLYTGQWENIDSNMTWQPKNYSLFVEDPFERPANTARMVRSEQLVEISKAFKMTLHKLNTHNQVPSSIIPFLVTSQTSEFLPRMMVIDPSLDYNNRAQPQMNRPNRGQSTAKHQIRNGNKSEVYDQGLDYNNRIQREIKRENRGRWRAKGQVDELDPNKTDTQRPVQKQEQQVWRPRSNGLSEMNRANCGLWQAKCPGQDVEKAQDGEQAPTKVNIQRPAQVSKNQEQQVWRPISKGNKDQSN